MAFLPHRRVEGLFCTGRLFTNWSLERVRMCVKDGDKAIQKYEANKNVPLNSLTLRRKLFFFTKEKRNNLLESVPSCEGHHAGRVSQVCHHCLWLHT